MSLIIKDRNRALRDEQYIDDDDDAVADVDCLALRKVLSSGSPGKTVWIALEEAAKHHRQKQLKRKESQATMTPSNKKPVFYNCEMKNNITNCYESILMATDGHTQRPGFHCRLEPFDENFETFSSYVQRLENYFNVNALAGQDDEAAKKRVQLLLSYLNPKYFQLLVALTAPEKPAAKTYEELLQILQEHLHPTPNEVVEQNNVFCRLQQKGYVWLLACGSVLIGGAILTLIWTPFEILMQERLRMTRGLPPYEWWADPPDTVHFYAYVFNVTNHEEFLNGLEPKLKIQEIGPYVFREQIIHTDIHSNPNGTLTYTSIRKPIFLTELNNLPLNDTIIVPNIPYLAMASQLSQAPFFMRIAFNMLVNRANTQPFVRKTVNDYFWNFTDPLIDLALTLVPSMVPTNNTGILHTVYQNFEDVVTVNIGTDHGDFNFFKIDKLNGHPGFGFWENQTCDSVQGSTEGVSYHQNIKKTDAVLYLRRTICRVVPLYYIGETTMHGMEAYRFEISNTTWSRPPVPEDECYWNKRYPLLPSGLSDISPCYFGMPLASSFPHFYNGDPVLTDKLDGLVPDWEKHGSEAILEPNTGLPFTEWARSQCNLVMRKMGSFPKLRQLTDMALPLFWLEYRVLRLPDKVINLLYLVMKVVKPYQTYMSIMALFIGALCWTIAVKRLCTRNSASPTKMGYNSVKAVFSPPERTV